MPSFLVCIHLFEAASPRILHEVMYKHEYGRLYGAVPVELPSLEVADKLRTKARGNSFDKFGFAFPEQIHDDEDYFIYHFSPFFKRQKTPFDQWDQHTERGVEGDFYTYVQDGWEYQDAKVAILLTDEALDQWGCVEVAAARRDYENWKNSPDARQEKPENHAFYCLRECEENDREIDKIYSGDNLTKAEWDHIHNRMFHGFDFDMTMLRLSTMNLVLHGLENPNIHYCDTLSNSMPSRFPELASDVFSIILANPPFKGSLDAETVHKSLTGKVSTKKTELLFLVLMLRMLKIGGRCGVVVPDGVLFGSSTAHKDLRRLLVNENQLEAVISLPSGVFKPYAGVSTAVLIFTKGGQTENVFFYDVQADGFSLDDKRQKVTEDDLPDMLAQWKKWRNENKPKKFADRTQKSFVVPCKEIEENGFDLSIGRYKEHVHEEIEYDPPKKIIRSLRKLEADIAKRLDKLEGMLK